MGKKEVEETVRQLAEALDKVVASLNATNELLRASGLQTNSRLTAATAGVRSTMGEADAAPRAETREVEDEPILLALAASAGLDAPMQRLIDFRNQNRPHSRPNYWAIVDFNLHSSNPRLFLFDVRSSRVDSYLCAHGRGSEGASDDGMADVFSNEDGSNCSSLGVYVCAETYYGDNGYSLRLDGKESTNFNARHRAVVIHGANYVSQDFIEQTGRIGRSLGCPALENRFADDVINALKDGSLLNIWKA